MKMLGEYLENAIKFEQMAAEEKDATLKAQFEKQAFAYRKLAEKERRILASKLRAISDFYFELPNFGASPWLFDRFLGLPRFTNAA
jgi:hypothetical protein